MVGHGGSGAGSYLTDPTFPIPSHRASIVVTSALRDNINRNTNIHFIQEKWILLLWIIVQLKLLLILVFTHDFAPCLQSCTLLMFLFLLDDLGFCSRSCLVWGFCLQFCTLFPILFFNDNLVCCSWLFFLAQNLLSCTWFCSLLTFVPIYSSLTMFIITHDLVSYSQSVSLL